MSILQNIRISRNEELIFIRINDKLIMYSIEFEILFASLNINNINNGNYKVKKI